MPRRQHCAAAPLFARLDDVQMVGRAQRHVVRGDHDEAGRSRDRHLGAVHPVEAKLVHDVDWTLVPW